MISFDKVSHIRPGKNDLHDLARSSRTSFAAARVDAARREYMASKMGNNSGQPRMRPDLARVSNDHEIINS